MAEAIARKLTNSRIEVCSAGLSPTGHVSEEALSVLEELGYPNQGLRSKSLEEIDLGSQDFIVSLIGEDGLRWLPRHLPAARIAWQVRDPYGEDEEVFLAVARVLENRIGDLLKDLEMQELPTS
ncbi:MAG: low molecular weight phosphatase family protein [bacterium]|nr:low molecular weight phosphatase family protein [bacterium]